MKALVTGGTGFTGNVMVRKLCESGANVRVLVRSKSKESFFNGLDVEIVEGDVTDPESVDRAVKGVEKVFHIAAVYRTAGISNAVYRDVHVKGTENLLNSSVKHGVEKFIHCSTIGIHGHIEHPPADETYRFEPGDIYQRTKLEGELKASAFGKETGLPVTVIRPCAIYGPGDMRLYKLFKMVSKKLVIILGKGDIFYHMVHVNDLLNAFLLASTNEKAIGEAFIIGGAEALTLNEIIDSIGNVLNIKPLKIHLPAKPFQLLGSLCEGICIPLRIEPPIYRRRVDFFTKSRSFDITKARTKLNYDPQVSIKEGLAQTAAWYKKHNLL